ncbi:aldehyde oxidase and xanthine dehydrogenase molybdopterin binding protein [Catenovulum agarivorans DS-2]|uniref:Aldehyde oxidase and xanthine dehydrogenase molybdopterin binding protein n=1 Tax=Catenovulum agarivorans DS-2 TaxID=1328313 RepID=W7QV89_9ALTE|nr:molybdopterin cofactor-binding domain-containing protein [Catenovulum agarivorans]EWH09210.1 aldehyde oxidase and xanthine dehydrogenase molybdopterin binding protein [Catenovulum agarivorans DS-2]
MDNALNIQNVSRRQFIRGASASTAVFSLQCTIPLSALTVAEQAQAQSGSALNLFVNIAKDNTVTLTCHRSEMGQGIRTSVAQVIADELEADWQYVNVIQAIGDKAYGDQNTDGSQSIRRFLTELRQFGASAQYMLKQAAANFWQVDISQCEAKNHYVTNNNNGRKLSYGDLAELASAITVPDANQLTLKKPEQFNYIGKGLKSLDLDSMINGTAEYGQDVQIPNMLYACLKRAPVMGSTIAKVDLDNTKKQAGVVDAFTMGEHSFPVTFNAVSSVAVVATNTWAAKKALDALNIQWRDSEYSQYDSQADVQTKQQMAENGKSKRQAQANKQGPKPKDLTELTATYTLPYLAHAPMEPPAATAMFHKDGSCEIWSCVQSPQAVQRNVAQRVGLKPEQVKVNVTLLGGAFGRKAQPDFVVEAALIAKRMGQPVKVVWSREDDIQHDYYHTNSVIHHKAQISRTAGLYRWDTHVAFTPIQSLWNINKDIPNKNFELRDIIRHNFNIDKMQTHAVSSPAHTRIGWLRSVANIQNAFSIGCFMDEVAHALKQNPLAHWNHLLGNQPENSKLKNVTNRVCEMANWQQRDSLPEDEALGLAAHHSFASDIAVVSHVKVTGNKLTVKKVYLSIDAGTIVNIDRVKAQMESAIIFGLSIALLNEISFKNGAVEQSNFHDFQVLRINQSPEIQVDVVKSTDKPGGVGEPGVPPVPPSIVNAVYAATGKRHRSLPLNQFYTV